MRKVIEVKAKGGRFIATTDGSVYRLYNVWYDNGWHRKMAVKSDSILVVIARIHAELAIRGYDK